MLQFDPFQITPDPFIRVQFWGVGGQLLQMNPFCTPVGEEVFDGLASMNERPILEHQHFPRNMLQQMLQKPHDIRRCVGPHPGELPWWSKGKA